MNQPLTSARVAAILPERASVFNIDRKLALARDEGSDDKPGTRRGRSASPIRANVKRRRSVVSAPGDVQGRQPSSGAESKSQFQETVTPQQKEPAHERSTNRRTSHADEIERRKRRKADGKIKIPNKPAVDKSESIKKSLKVTKGPKQLVVPPLLLPEGVEDDKDDEKTYERKGVFKLKRDKGPNKFRFPKPHSHPEPLWRAGDGFSVNEARPNFAFSMTGTHKQMKPKSTPGVGELQLETYDGNEEDPHRSGVDRLKNQRLLRYEMKHRRGVVKDVWPTIDNFSEELEVRKRNPTVPANEKIIPSTLRPQPTPVPQARETLVYNSISIPMPRKRRSSDFENFGRHIGNGNMISNTRIAETQIDPTRHITQSESMNEEGFGDEAADEVSEVEGEEEEYEPMISTGNDMEVDGSGRYNLSGETLATTPWVFDMEDSDIAVLNDIRRRLRELKRHDDNIMASGDIARGSSSSVELMLSSEG
ncbi:uncharacterized protein F4807DRAFT_468643 [Annulohypoxylon truncatum]|uniref:uncharacterized protein n=1 Tax=Annulohypoxylon truncatum TaxID=327061 RepID=UPI002007A222|nr:uncharacterized protein F4807DRAFT_468643 [Annulohypoxylon truncatum]KAI1208385.1 hypothetical protein F4807DRAFT_468643 [Annulohypoxylon truncatum]